MNNRLPEKLLDLRKHYHYSQKSAAEKLGIDLMEYMSYENGAAVPPYALLKRIARLYRVTVLELFSNETQVVLRRARAVADVPLKDRIRLFLQRNKRYLFIGGALLAVLLFVLFKPDKPEKIYELPEILPRETLSCSDTSVVRLDAEGHLIGSGDNSNGQLELKEEGLIKVAEGATFTVALKNNGTVVSAGLLEKVADDISGWKDIVAVATGSGHVLGLENDGDVVCAGDNTYGQCNYEERRNIKRIFALPQGSVLVREDGTVITAGDFVGSSQLRKQKNLLDVRASEDNLVYLKDNGTVGYYARRKDFDKVLQWKDITAVACGNDFIAGLTIGGNVQIVIDNYILENEVSTWNGITAIAAGNDYLVAVDQEGNLYGIGRNIYHQFDDSSLMRNSLPQVRNVKVEIGQEYVIISFDPVTHASGYLVTIDVGIGYGTRVEEPYLVIPKDNFENGKTYLLHITALGEGEYQNSEVLALDFRYQADASPGPVEPTPAPTSDVVEVPFSLDGLTGKTVNNFLAYLHGLGVRDDQLSGSESGNICSGGEPVVESVGGISDYEQITRSELSRRQINYTYCRMPEPEPTTTPEPEPTPTPGTPVEEGNDGE